MDHQDVFKFCSSLNIQHLMFEIPQTISVLPMDVATGAQLTI